MMISCFYQSLRRFEYIAFLVGSILLLSSCESPNTPDYVADTDYFPLQTGDFWIYQVNEERYALTTPVAKRTYQIQQKIGSSFNRNGQTYFQVEEAIRTSAAADWRIQAVRTLYKNPVEVVSQEPQGSSRLMLFPVSEQTIWDKNEYQTGLDTSLHYAHIGQPFLVGTRRFLNTITVVGPQDSTLVGQQIYRQVYVPNLGLVHRQEAALEYCQTMPDCIGKAQIVSGYRQTWSLIDSNRF